MLIEDLVWFEDIGKDKPKSHNVGILMTKDDGKKSVKINVTPVGNWNGWLSVFPKKDKPVPSELAPDEVTDIEAF